MLRVCGITYDHTINYGSCFQAYALQHAVEGVILQDGTVCQYRLIPIKKTDEWPAKVSLLLLPIISLYRARFVRFEKKHMHYAQVRSISELPELNKTTDAFMCGSDVIWNPDMNHRLNAFYLDFAEKYKFSYAASFGKAEIDEQTLSSVREPLSLLDAISVREKSGADIVRRITGKPVQITADPVFLMDAGEWESLMPVPDKKKKYIFVYITHVNRVIRAFIDELKKETGLCVIYAAYGPKQAVTSGIIQVQTPEKWLRLIHDAEYVVTNSFHATAFSVLFHRKFFTVVGGSASKGNNVRMFDLLTSAGLSERIYSSVPGQIDLSEIDYAAADKRMSEMREESLAFLTCQLETANRIKNGKT